MKGAYIMIAGVLGVFLLAGFSCAPQPELLEKSEIIKKDMEPIMDQAVRKDTHVVKKVLDNGMTILVRPSHTVPKVSIQLWYHVGSKDEADSERGIAHLIEHMIFKGTKEMLSESDINMLTHKLSGNTNAFTSYDYTGYLFNFPEHHWHEALPVMADCMRNVRFDEQMLSSEMKAVIQELKMYKDKYVRSLIDEMMGAIFTDHPYHHPIIGYKQDLWSVHSDDLRAFYEKHYVPNNATLVITGAVDPQDVFARAEKYFGSIAADNSYKRKEHYFTQDIGAKSVTIYRDVKQPICVYSFLVPGIIGKKDHIINLLAFILGKGKSSRLYRKIVDELQLATALSASGEELFDHGMLLISAQPKSYEAIEQIEQIIKDELTNLAQNGFEGDEFERALKQSRMEIYDMLEDTEHQAYEIGKYFLATGDENYIFNFLEHSEDQMKKDMQNIIVHKLRPAVMHSGYVMPLPESEKAAWAALQAESDKEDERILSARVRTTPIEPARYANTIEIKEPGAFDYPKPESFTLPNGLKVLSYHNDTTPKVQASLSLKAKYYYDPEDKQGLSRFVNALLDEGTQNYSVEQFANEVESRGMAFSAHPGGLSISMLTEDLEFGLGLIDEVYNRALFDEEQIEKVRAQILSRLKSFWDSAGSVSSLLTKEHIYGDHPYSKNSLGTFESIQSITRDDIVAYAKKYFTPQDATLALVGDLSKHNVQNIVQKTLGSWTGDKIETIDFPQVVQTQAKEIEYPMNRDQVVLGFASKSVSRFDADYDKLLLFNQIFGGGSLGSMSSRLFELREQSGLFYTINGSLTAGSDEQPGMTMVRTIVSQDRLAEAEKVIKETIDTAVNTVTDDEFNEARRAVLNSMVDLFSSNESIAGAFLFLERFKLPKDFFDTRSQTLGAIDKQSMQDAVRKYMKSDDMITVRVGRVEQKSA